MKLFSALVIVVLFSGLIFLVGRNKPEPALKNIQNVSMVDGKQVVEIKAKGGYIPEKSIAKAGVPTVLRINTQGTFDCSASVRIPSMNISEILPNSGVKDIDLGIQKAGTLQGSCGMGMYPFEIVFQD